MNDIQVGNYIKATRKDDPKITATDTVSHRYEDGDVNGHEFYLSAKYWDFEVIERPYKLPTEPGLYTLTPSGGEEYLFNYRLVRLEDTGRWQEKEWTQEEHDKLVKEFNEDKRVLRRLVIKED